MSFWNQPENVNRGDNPNWNPAPPTEAQQQEAALYLVQMAARDLEKRRKLKAKSLQDDEEKTDD